ncbi:MAG: thioredoxin family protein [Verrucomicrobiales bacterium]|nr:thioredoxin family protein [Verrucomicrobiales bacterium]
MTLPSRVPIMPPYLVHLLIRARPLVRLLTAFALLATATSHAASATSARLLLPIESVKPGDKFLAGLELQMKPGWHTYWRNGGDSGAPTTLEWTLPDGIKAGEIQWPAPETYEEMGLVTFIYHGKVMLLIPFEVASNAPPGTQSIAAKVKWLECEKQCVPGNTSVQAQFVVGNTSKDSSAADLIRAAEAKIPKPAPAGVASASWDGPPAGDERALVLRWQAAPTNGIPDFFPYGGDGFEVATATERLPSDGKEIYLRKKVRKFEGEWPRQLGGLLVTVNAQRQPIAAAAVQLDLQAPGAAEVGPPASPTSGGRPPTSLARPPSFLRAMALAFLGGLILNVMPCVLPVIALKILGFVRQSGSRPAEVRKLGWVYGLGVWVSFLVLAGAVIAVKRAVGIASWGMQFGNPIFLVGLTTLILLVALSLFGVFEINLTGRALDKAGDLTTKEGPAGAFFNGVLAVALATPCTAPFLAPALGYAFTADATTIVAIFSMVAFGLAFPYVVLSWQPAWLKFLPKPGTWMEKFKVAMGFPMLATTLWLYTLAADHFGEGGPLWLGIYLIGIAIAAWIWGEFVQRGRRRQSFAMALAAGVLAASYVFVLEGELHWRASTPKSEATVAASTRPRDPESIAWQPWSHEAVAKARAEGRPILVDFTARWCPTCKSNKAFAIEIEPVRAKLRAINAVTLRADNTNLPRIIVEELQRFGRAGVPLVLVYPQDRTQEPIVLPEFLTPQMVLDALDQAVATPATATTSR